MPHVAMHCHDRLIAIICLQIHTDSGSCTKKSRKQEKNREKPKTFDLVDEYPKSAA